MLFDELDADGSKTLCRKEIEHIADKMGAGLLAADLDIVMEQLDPGGTGHGIDEKTGHGIVTFDAFRNWYRMEPSAFNAVSCPAL